LFVIQERVRAALIRLADMRMKGTSVPDSVLREIFEVVRGSKAIPRP